LGGLVLVGVLAGLATPAAARAQSSDPVAQAIAEGDLYQSKRKYDLAIESYRKADKLSHHTSAQALIKIALIEKKAGLLSDAASDAKKALVAAGDNKTFAWQARLLRATLLTQMAGKPTDNKLKDAEAELRAAVLLDLSQPLAHYDLGIVLLKQERDADGIAELNALLALPKLDSDMAADARRMIANPIRARTPFVPSFSFVTRENQTISNVSLRGKVALLDFWGTWCPPCRASVPMLKNVQRKYATKGLQMVSVSSDDDEEAWKAYVDSQHMEWAEYLDSSGAVQKAFKIESFPTFIVVDKDGVIRFRESGIGSETQDDLEEAINRALKRNSDPALAKAAAEELEAAPAKDIRPQADNKGNSQSNPNIIGTGVNDVSASPPERRSSAMAPTAANVYKNASLGIRYEFPEGWIAAKPETLRAANLRLQESQRQSLLKQQFQAADDVQVLPPVILLYASGRGDGEPDQPVLSSIVIRAQQTSMDRVDEQGFRERMEKMASAGQMKLLAPAAAFEVARHKFLRADFERSVGALHYYLSIVEAMAGGSLLHIEILASSTEEFHQIAGTLQTMEIDDEE
jgi:thiol-disulfide isomerase/thioredoxin